MAAAKNYGAVQSIEELQQLCDRLLEDKLPVGFDIESGYIGPDREGGSLLPDFAFVVGFSITNSTEWARYVPVAHDFAINLDPDEAFAILKPVLETLPVIAHNIAFESRFLSRVGIKINHYSDSMLEGYLLSETGGINTQGVGLKHMTQFHFNHDQKDIESLFPPMTEKQKKCIRFNVLDVTPEVIAYACEDALWCLALCQKNRPRVEGMLLYRVEHEIVEQLEAMSDWGVKINFGQLNVWAAQAASFHSRLNAEILADLSAMTGNQVTISLASSKQLQRVLYDQLGFKTTRTTKAGAPSTDRVAMAALAKRYPVVDKILKWREIGTLLSRYLEKWPREYAWHPDGRVHANINQVVVGTGRLAVNEPPLQQCVDGATEVLTPSGWVRFDQLDDGVPVAQYWRDSRIEFTVPGQVIRQHYQGSMAHLIIKGREFVYTPDHRIPSFARRSGALYFDHADDWVVRLNGGRVDRVLPFAGHRHGGRILTDEDRASLQMAILAQCDSTLNRYADEWYDVNLLRERAQDRLHDINLPHLHYESGRVRGKVRRHQVEEWLDATPEKNFIPEAILSLCEQDLHWFIDECMFWDGDWTRRAAWTQGVPRTTSVDTFQAAAALCGCATSTFLRERNTAVQVNMCWRERRQVRDAHAFMRPYDGTVYCVTVPSGMFLTRRQGMTLVTGNCPKKFHYELNDGTVFEGNFRDCIVAEEGWYFLDFDYSQVELRVMAGLSGETALLDAFNNDRDVHTITASMMLGIPASDITEEQRAIGKTMNFALLYGMGVKSLSDRLAIDKERAAELYNAYFSGFASITSWMEKQKLEGKARGYTISKFGRKYTIWELQSSNPAMYSKGERVCVNAPVQGGAADYMKVAMCRVRRVLEKQGLWGTDVKVIMNNHDALTFEVRDSVSPNHLIELLRPAVEFPVEGFPKIAAEFSIGRKWGSMKKLDGSEHEDDDIEIDEDGEIILPDIAEQAVEYLARRTGAAPEDNSMDMNDPQALQAVQEAVEGGAIEAVPHSGRRVIVEIAEMPNATQYQRFIDLCSGHPGPNTIVLRTPEGEMETDWGVQLTPESQPQVSLIFSGARMFYSAESVDTSALVGDLNL